MCSILLLLLLLLVVVVLDYDLTESVVEHAILLCRWFLFVVFVQPGIVNAAPQHSTEIIKEK